MRSRSSLGLIFPLLLVCFTAGVLSVVLKPPSPEPALIGVTPSYTTNSAPLASTEFADSRSTVLILGVDSLNDPPAASLQTAWLITFGSREQPIQLFGLPYDALLPDGKTLRGSFSIFDPPDFGAAFISALASYTSHPILGWVVLDQVGFARLVDYLGGFSLGDQGYDGNRTIGALNLLLDRPQESLKLQARILQALVERAPALGRTPEVTSLTTLVPEHAYTSPAAPQLTTLAIPLLPIDPSRVEITLLLDG